MYLTRSAHNHNILQYLYYLPLAIYRYILCSAMQAGVDNWLIHTYKPASKSSPKNALRVLVNKSNDSLLY